MFNMFKVTNEDTRKLYFERITLNIFNIFSQSFQ